MVSATDTLTRLREDIVLGAVWQNWDRGLKTPVREMSRAAGCVAANRGHRGHQSSRATGLVMPTERAHLRQASTTQWRSNSRTSRGSLWGIATSVPTSAEVENASY